MRKTIETQRAPDTISPHIQGANLGSTVFTSKQIPVYPQAGRIPTDMQNQACLSLEGVKAIVVTIGLSVGDIIKTIAFITDLNDSVTINKIYEQLFSERQTTHPTRSCVQVVRLLKNMKSGIEAITVRST